MTSYFAKRGHFYGNVVLLFENLKRLMSLDVLVVQVENHVGFKSSYLLPILFLFVLLADFMVREDLLEEKQLGFALEPLLRYFKTLVQHSWKQVGVIRAVLEELLEGHLVVGKLFNTAETEFDNFDLRS